MIVIGNSTIKIVQGDSYERTVTLEGVLPEAVDKIYFSCSGLKFCKSLYYDETNENYVLSLSSEETNTFKEFYGDYDLTIAFIDNKRKTISYRSVFNVLPKINGLECYDG